MLIKNLIIYYANDYFIIIVYLISFNKEKIDIYINY
jgi:hypothetical protein